METLLIANILRLRRVLRWREGWTRQRLLEHQQHELATLRAFAAPALAVLPAMASRHGVRAIG